MNDRFKFRVYDTRKEKYLDTKDLIIRCNGEVAGKYGGTGTVEYWKLQQSTGVRDKNNKLIFEGDIVKIQHIDEIGVDDNDNYFITEDCYESVVKDYNVIEADFGDYDLWTLNWASGSDYIFEIIGNIYEGKQ